MSLTRSKHMNVCSLILQMGSNIKTYNTSTSCFILTNTPKTNILLQQKGLKVFNSKNINRYRYMQSIRCLNVSSYAIWGSLHMSSEVWQITVVSVLKTSRITSDSLPLEKQPRRRKNLVV